MSFPVLNYAKSKLLAGDFNMATSYYNRALGEGIASCIVDLRYLTKEYLVYPLEYENSTNYFELIKQLHTIANDNEEYMDEYILALNSLYDIKRLFLRSLALFYYSDILVTSTDSVVLRQIEEIQKYIRLNKEDLLENDVFELAKYVPKYNKKQFSRNLDIIEAYCLNILLSYTAEQHSIYQGKKYTALTVDYGYFYSTNIRSSDRYYNYANMKPRIFILGLQAYYYEIKGIYEEKLKELGGFNSPVELRKELTDYIEHKNKKLSSDKEFNQYAKHFEKQDLSRDSWYSTLMNISKKINPLIRLNPITNSIKNNVGSFELDEYFPQKKFLGVCSMIAAGQSWKVDTVRYITAISCCFAGLGVMAYLALAVAKKFGYYFGVSVEKP